MEESVAGKMENVNDGQVENGWDGSWKGRRVSEQLLSPRDWHVLVGFAFFLCVIGEVRSIAMLKDLDEFENIWETG